MASRPLKTMLPSTWLTALQLDFPCEVMEIDVTETQICFTLATVGPGACCPKCQTLSQRVHSHYRRTLQDVPLGNRSVRVHLQLRKFFCDNPACSQVIFAERLAPWLAPYARRSQRLERHLTAVGCANGGEEGARLAAQLQLGQWSPQVLLRLVRRMPEETSSTPRVLGVDDWAKRKGQSYGTILCDLERHQVIDLLADREADTLAAWLHAHPGVEVICRDRAGAYADGAHRGAPDALQVADRFHLLMNTSEAVQRVVDRHREALHVEVEEVAPQAPAPSPAGKRPFTSRGLPRPPHLPSQIRAQQEHKRQQRAERWTRARELIAQGLNRRAVCRQLHMCKRTLRRVLQTTSCPEHAARNRTLRGFMDELTRQWNAGEHNGRPLYRHIQSQGYRGSYLAVTRFLEPLRQQKLQAAEAIALPTAPTGSPVTPVIRTVTRRLLPRLVTRCLAGNPPAKSEEDQRLVAQLCLAVPDLDTARELATTFRTMLLEHQIPQLTPWLERAAAGSLPEFQALAASLSRDRAAVELAVSSEWSSGQVEGQVNRLKLIKRKMYGRGKLDLLRKRVVFRASAFT